MFHLNVKVMPLNQLFFLIVLSLLLYSLIALQVTMALDMDVKCAVYRHSDDLNGDNVDVRIYLLGLKPNSTYTALVMPDHSPPQSVTVVTDYEGIFWSVAKIPHGDNNLLFKVNIYNGNNTKGTAIASGDDDAPCYGIDIKN
jgi:hypothetical protein